MRSAPKTERRTATVARSRGRSGVVLFPLVAALLASLAYVNALRNPFVYDDHDTILGNASIVDLSNVRFLLVYSPFRPVVNVSYAIDRALWGGSPLGFHVTNAALHVVVVVLLYFWILRAIGDSRRLDDGRPLRMAAFAAAAIFAVHPLFTEAVGYISGRPEVLCAAWFMAALLLGTHAMISGSPVRGVAAGACGVLALLSKENGAALPVVLLAYDWLLRPGSDRARARRLWLLWLPLFALVGIAAVYRLMTLSAVSVGASPASPLLNGLTQAIVIWRYLGLLVWPAGQSIMHAVHRVSNAADPLAWVAVAGLAAITLVAFRLRRTEPLVALGVAWFFAAIAPSSSVVALREGMAEHRAYLACAGAMIVLAAGVHRLLVRRARLERPLALTLAFTAAIAVLFTLTVMRNQVWASPVTLWTEATRHGPGLWEPHYALADALREVGQCGPAVPEYEQVVAMRPSHRDAYTNLGICLAQTGRLEEAETAFRRALQIDPAFARGYTNLGALALVAGDAERARGYYREAIAQDPGNVLARLQLAKLYEQTFTEYRAAARMCGEARALAPATPGLAECVERNERLAAAKDRGRQVP